MPASKIDTARASSSPAPRQLGAAYPADTAIRLILDNLSAHISKETKAWVAAQPEGRFAFVFTPKHGSWLNLIEGFSQTPHPGYLDDLNRDPVVHSWTYKIGEAA